jgi:hypothetical protein
LVNFDANVISGDRDRIARHVVPIIEAGKNGGLVIGIHSIGPNISLDDYEFY